MPSRYLVKLNIFCWALIIMFLSTYLTSHFYKSNLYRILDVSMIFIANFTSPPYSVHRWEGSWGGFLRYYGQVWSTLLAWCANQTNVWNYGETVSVSRKFFTRANNLGDSKSTLFLELIDKNESSFTYVRLYILLLLSVSHLTVNPLFFIL